MDLAGIVALVEVGLSFIQEYGLIAIFILLVLDAALLLPVFPGELVLIIAVTTYVHDPTSLAYMIAFTTAASLVGSLMLYGIIRGGGRKLVERFPAFFMMPRKRREKLEKAFQKPSGQSMVLFLRLIPLTRIMISIPAGLARMPVIKFMILTTIGMTGFHTAFLWFAYESRRPGSAVGSQADQLQAAYASPAWNFVQANTVMTGFIVLLLGAVISLRASIQSINDPEESTGSLIGMLARNILLWGGLALAALMYLNRETAYWLLNLGGFDVYQAALALNTDAVTLLVTLAVFMATLGFILRLLGDKARRERRYAKRDLRQRKDHAAAEKHVAIERTARPEQDVARQRVAQLERQASIQRAETARRAARHPPSPHARPPVEFEQRRPGNETQPPADEPRRPSIEPQRPGNQPQRPRAPHEPSSDEPR